jgi:NhaP-type Na+/H+ or K+/H+ antiporter
MESEHILQTIALAIFLGVAAQVISHKLRLPSIIFLMLFGILAGPQVLHVLRTHEIPDITSAAISLGVAIILFEGAMTLHIPDLKTAPKAILGIIVAGPFITMAVVTVCLHLILGLGFGVAMVIGSILVVSGPTVVGPLLARAGVGKRLHDVLTWESIIVDAVGAALMVVTLQFVVSGNDLNLTTAGHFFGRLLLGGAIGYGTGKVLIFVIMRKLVPHDLLNLVILGIVLLAYWGANHLASESGLLTVTVAGLMLGQIKHPSLERIKDFKEQLSTLLISFLFILLSSRIDLSKFGEFGWLMVPAVLSILFIARPLTIFLTTIRTALNLREKLFLVWLAPRGIIAAATASLFSRVLIEKGYPQADAVETIVFLVIMSTVVLQGLTVAPVARLLKVTAPPRNGFLLIGIHEFSIKIAELLTARGVPVKLVDTKGDNLAAARAAGLDATVGNFLDEEFLLSLGLDRMGTMLALTEHDETNTLVCRLGRKLLGMDTAYQVVNTFLSDVTDEVLMNFGGLPAFDMKISISALNDRLRNHRLEVRTLELEASDKGLVLPDKFLFPLFFFDKGKIRIAQVDDEIKVPSLVGLVMV